MLCPQLRAVANLLCGSITRAAIIASTRSRSRDGLRSNNDAMRRRFIAEPIACTAPWARERMISNTSSTGASALPLSTARIASACSIDNEERFAMVRLTIFLPSRMDSRRRIAGGDLRFGTMSIYMDSCIPQSPYYALI